MTIKKRLLLGVVLSLIIVSIIVVFTVVGSFHVRKNIHKMTAETAPYQIRAAAVQRTMANHAANLTAASAAGTVDEQKASATKVGDSRDEVTKANSKLAELKGTSPDDREIIRITEGILKTSEKKVAASEAARVSAESIEKRLKTAGALIKELDADIRKLQQGTSGSMVSAVNVLIGTNAEMSAISGVWNGIQLLKQCVSDIGQAEDKGSVGRRKEDSDRSIDKILAALKSSNNKKLTEISPTITALKNKFKKLASSQIDYINKEEEQYKTAAADMGKEIRRDIAFVEPAIEGEINRANDLLKTNTADMSKNMSAFGDTNTILSYAASLSLTSASISEQITQVIHEQHMDDFNRITGLIHALFAKVDASGIKLQELLTKGGYKAELKLLADVQRAIAEVKGEYAKASERVKESIQSKDELGRLNANMREVVAKQLEESNKEVTTAGTNQEEAIQSLNTTMNANMSIGLITGIGGIIAVLLLNGWNIRSITKPLGNLYATVTDIAKGEGDLTKRLEVRGNDEIASICTHVNTLMEKLQGSFRGVKDDTSVLNISADKLSETSGVLSKRIEDESIETATLATAAEEMSATVVDVARNAHSAADFSSTVRDTAVRGVEVVMKSVDGIKELATSVEEVSGTMEKLSISSQKIGEIVSVISDIAEQTNLLALNAAIEAARAGEQGRGFAVVADSVRQLADRTGQSTGEISSMIREIQTEVDEALTLIGKGLQKAGVGVDLATQAGEALKRIVAGVEQIDGMVDQIAAAANEQSTTVDSMVSRINHVAMISRESAEETKGLTSTAGELKRVSAELKVLTDQFKV
jgi:methyl-accepting chemotaxis protein